MIDFENIKEQYPINKLGHYFANASISGQHINVYEAQRNWLEETMLMGGTSDERYFEILQSTRESLAQSLSVSPEEVALVSNSSYAFNIMAMLLKQKTNKRKILIPHNEFPTTYLPWQYQGFEVVPIKEIKGEYTLESFSGLLDSDTAAVACSGILSFNGLKLPLKELGALLNERSIPLFVNQTQSAGAFDLEFQSAKMTGMCFSCHKRYGACMGTTVFVLRKNFYEQLQWPLVGWTSVEEPWEMKNTNTRPRMDMSSLELGSMPFSNIAGIYAAQKIQNEQSLELRSKRIVELEQFLLKELSELPLIYLAPYQNLKELSGIVSFRIQNIDVTTIVESLKVQKIIVNQRKDFIRVSLTFYNDENDILALKKALKFLLIH